MKKGLKILFGILKGLVVIFTVLVVGVILIQRIFGNDFSLFGYRIFTVVTGSMEPEYNVKDIIISKEVEPKTLVVGDDVVYIGDEGTFTDKVVTHRIIRIEEVDGERQYVTQGIANFGEDPAITGDQIYGKVLGKSTILSFISGLVSTPIGFLLLIMIPGTFLIGGEIFYKLEDKEAGE